MSTVWQIASGDWGRDYSDLMLDHDVMMMGPGEHGSMTDDLTSYEAAVEAGGLTGAKLGGIKAFHKDIKSGDIILLRRGKRVLAIGLIDQDVYDWDERFDDVYGWDLQHSRRVVWQHQLSEQINEIQQDADLFADRKQIPTFTRVADEKVLSRVEPLFSECRSRPLKDLPDPPGNLLFDKEIGDELFMRGLSLAAVDELMKAIGRQRRLLQWYNRQGDTSGRPNEHEVVAYMVLPMLLALGWSEQLLAVEWRKVDIAAFHSTPTEADKCVLLCEVKGLWHGLQDTLAQAVAYVGRSKLVNCRRIMLTQGARFYVFGRESENSHLEWNPRPVGYFNVEKMRRSYVVPPGTDALDTLMSLTPARMLESNTT